MNVFTNEDHFKAQLALARRLQLIGIACIAGFVVFTCGLQILLASVPPELQLLIILLGYVFILLGFPLWTIGSNRIKLLNLKPRADTLITNELKGLSNKYTLHHYVSTDSGVIKHLLVGPGGLIVIDSRGDVGPVNCKSVGNEDRWRLPGGFFARYINDGLSSRNPTADLETQMAQADALLARIGKPDVPINGFIVFTKQEDFEMEGCSRRAIPLDETRALVKAIVAETESDRGEAGGVDQLLTSDDRRRLNDLIAPKQPPPASAAPAAKSPAKAATERKTSQSRQ